VVPGGPFRAVSLDLWFTSIFYPPELESQWSDVRLRTVGELLRARTGDRLELSRVGPAVEAVHSQLEAQGKNPGLVDPQALLTEYAEVLEAEFALPAVEAGRIFSAAGLDEHPPKVNPELAGVVHALEARQVPVIAITNTARRGETWRRFFREQAGVNFDHILTSCEIGKAKPDSEIFHEASRRLGLAPEEILHVGDRWELDVEGAQRAGFGAVLYRGLWPHYPPGMYPETDSALLKHPRVLTVDRLDELLTSGWLDKRP
jgi:HAD superfamily hydrolase (TIGR01509 family)